MNTDRIDVFHAADGDRMVVGITHNLELDLFITFNGFLDQNLAYRGQLECIDTDLHQFFVVVSKTAAGTA